MTGAAAAGVQCLRLIQLRVEAKANPGILVKPEVKVPIRSHNPFLRLYPLRWLRSGICCYVSGIACAFQKSRRS